MDVAVWNEMLRLCFRCICLVHEYFQSILKYTNYAISMWMNSAFHVSVSTFLFPRLFIDRPMTAVDNISNSIKIAIVRNIFDNLYESRLVI